MEYIFHINVPYHEMMALYKGQAQRVVVRDRQGRTISLPATRFQPFMSHQGVKGWFRLETSAEGKFISLTPLRAS